MFCKDVANIVGACLAKYIYNRLRAVATLSGETILVLSIWQLWWFFAMADQVDDMILVILVAVLANCQVCQSRRKLEGGFANHS